MDTLFALLFFISIFALIIGLIKPKLVLWKGGKTRKKVLIVYFLLIIAFFFLFNITYTEENLATENPTQNNAVVENTENISEGDKEKAEEYYNEYKKDVMDYILGKKNEEEGLELLNSAIDHNPNEAKYYGEKATLLDYNGKKDLAIDAYKKAINLNPDYYIYYSSLASIHKEREQYEKAIVQFDKAIASIKDDNLSKEEENKNIAAYYSKIGECYFELDNKEKALENYKNAAETHPDYEQGYQLFKENL